MTAADVAEALAFKGRNRCGWQNVAQFAGVSLHDVRRHCDPAYAAALPPRGAPAIAPAAMSEAAHKSKPHTRAVAILHTIPWGAAVLRALLTVGAGPQGRFVTSGVIASHIAGCDGHRVGIAIRSLRGCAKALVEPRDGTITPKVWRLTTAGWEAAQSERST